LGQQDTRIMDSRSPDAIKAILPLQFFPEPEEFTGPFVLLASRQNNQTLTGVMINADAGLGIRGIRNVAGGLEL
jgi:2,3-dihydroxy-2,3-dihydrophenylpropionate dehydrogenase